MKSPVLAATLLASALLSGQDFKVGSRVANFAVLDMSGKAVMFDDLKGPVTVVTFISVQCPVSNAYNDRMNDIYKEYSARNVHFIFVNANSTESAAEVARHARAVGFAFPVYKDPNNVVADRFGATVTPESYVIDRSGIVRYHGQVDDSRNPARVTKQTLRMALDEVLAGKPVAIQETKAFGCSIKRVHKT